MQISRLWGSGLKNDAIQSCQPQSLRVISAVRSMPTVSRGHRRKIRVEQLDLFDPPKDRQRSRKRAARSGRAGSSGPVCWTRMQAEAGEQLSSIIDRKERERAAGRGRFFWGIGSALSVPLRERTDTGSIPVLFSKMLSRPRGIDSNPDTILVWRKYYDEDGGLMDLPPHVLLLSRGHTPKGLKNRHYALVCKSRLPLVLDGRRSFDPGAYRNAKSGAAIGFSQVTALVRRVTIEGTSRYTIDLEADLVRPYCVRLADPGIVQAADRERLSLSSGLKAPDWLKLVRSIRKNAKSPTTTRRRR